MKRTKKLLFVAVLILSCLLCSCESGGGGSSSKSTPKQLLSITISDSIADENVDRIVRTDTPIVLKINEELPEDLADLAIKWYSVEPDGNILLGTGRVFEFKPAENSAVRNDNIRYKIYATFNTSRYKGTSNSLSLITLVDDSQQFRDYIKIIYDHIDITDFKPGLSVSIYSKSKNIDFNFYHGLAQLNNKKINTEETQHILGSISKSFTAAAVVSLCSDLTKTLGSFDLDFTDAGDAIIKTDATLEEMLTHTSGMGDYVGIKIVADLFCYGKNPNIQWLLGRTLRIDNPSYKFKDWTPAKPLQYIMENPNGKGSVLYSTPVFEILGMIVEKQSKTTMNEYLATNFFTDAIGTKGMKLPPQDSVSYKDLAHPHIITASLKDFINAYSTGISDSDVNTLISMISEGKELFDFTDFIPEVNKLFCEAAWCAGAMTGTSKMVARWCYNLLCKCKDNSALTNINNVDVHEIIRESATSLASTSVYGYGVKSEKKKDLNGENPITLYGHVGRTAGSVNYMYYNDNSDTSYAILMDCLEETNLTSADYGIDLDNLIYDLVKSDLP